MTRYFYTDPLAAAWMAMHYGMEYIQPDGCEFDWQKPPAYSTFDGRWRVPGEKLFIHPDSLHLLEPQLGDIVTVNDPAIDYHGYCFRPDILYRTYAEGSYGTDEFACAKSADVRVVQRHCGGLIAFPLARKRGRMTRYLVIAAALLCLPAITDWMVDHRSAHEPVGYTRQERDAMSRLVERSVAPKYRWSNRKAAVMAEVWGVTPQELDRPVNIFGEGKRKW